MTQKHYAQNGTFHVTTNAKGKLPLLTLNGVPELLIDNLMMTRSVQKAEVYAFCILPNHMHILMRPGERGLSDFMRSFKCNSSLDIRRLLRSGGPRASGTVCKDIFWKKGFYDKRIRDANQRSNALSYIKYNAVKDGLVNDIDHWSWSSHHFKHLLDPMELWFDSPYDHYQCTSETH